MGNEESLQQQEAKTELQTLLSLMGIEAEIEAFTEDEEILLHVESSDAGRLIGRGGEMLMALQYILNRTLHRKDNDVFHCTVDVERYLERRRDKLLQEAYEAADKVERTGRPYRFTPLRAADRKIIHQALKDREGLCTESEQVDDEPSKKRLVVKSVENTEDEGA